LYYQYPISTYFTTSATVSLYHQLRRGAEDDPCGDDEEISDEAISTAPTFSDQEKDRASNENAHNISNDIENINIEMEKIKLRKMRLEIEREALKLEQEKMYAQIAHDQEMLNLETAKGKSRFQLTYYETQQERYWKDLFDEKRNQRRQERIYFLFRMLVSLLLVIAGIWLLSRGDSLGAYLLGTGAGSIGLHSASNVLGNTTHSNRKETGESSGNDKSFPKLNGGM
jgi:hypothetical protein